MAKLRHIPKLYTILKWSFLVAIAVVTAMVGFFQSMLVSWLYQMRSSIIYNVVDARNEKWIAKFFQYTGFNLLLAFMCTFALFAISPAASGSGIPDVKAYLNGVESPIFKNFFTLKTFIAKVIGSALAVSSSLVMGKEGPMLHAGSILAVLLGSSKWFNSKMDEAANWGTYTYNKEIRDLVACGAACGVTTAFKATVGGVLFSYELSTRWRKELTWRCFLVCAITIVVVRLCVTTCVNYGYCTNLKWGSLIWFTITFPSPYYQIWAVFLLSIIGGYLGCLYISFNTWVCVVRKKWGKYIWLRMAEVCCISVITSSILYGLSFAGECKPCDLMDPVHCISGGAQFRTFRQNCPDDNHYNDLAVLVFNPQGFVIQALYTASSNTFSMWALMLYSVTYWVLAAVTYGAFIPSGLFTPSLIFGGCFGRMYAEVLVWMHLVDETDVGMYALLGAASFLGGLMRMSAAQALILMEMTQAPNQLPFLMFALVVSKGVGDRFNYGVFEHQMMLKGLAFVGIQSEAQIRRAKLEAKDVMVVAKPENTLQSFETGERLSSMLDKNRNAAAFPVVAPSNDPSGKCYFVGMISRQNVTDLVDLHGKTEEPIDLTKRAEVAPVIAPPHMPLPFIYRFVNEGFNYIPIIKFQGLLEGVIGRQQLVDTQNNLLDKFHLKENLEKMKHDVDQGKILKSMQLQDNTHAKVFRGIIQNPIAAAKDYLERDEDKPEEDVQTEFFYSDYKKDGRGEEERIPLVASAAPTRHVVPPPDVWSVEEPGGTGVSFFGTANESFEDMPVRTHHPHGKGPDEV